MKRFLIRYLAVTGIGTVIVTTVPQLVLIGFLLAIIPGIILSCFPTAFLYGAIFSATWFALRLKFRDRTSAVIASGITIVTVLLIPMAENHMTTQRYRSELAGDHLPLRQISLHGHVRLDVVHPFVQRDIDNFREVRLQHPEKDSYYRGFWKCSRLCEALLFTEGIESVTADWQAEPVFDPHYFSRYMGTFTRVGRHDCRDAITPKEDAFDPINWPPIVNDLEKTWQRRLASTDCITANSARRSYDYRIVITNAMNPVLRTTSKGHGDPELSPNVIHVSRFEIFDDKGASLIRQTSADARKLTVPLLYLPVGGFGDIRFAWKSWNVEPANSPGLQSIDVLKTNTNLNVLPD